VTEENEPVHAASCYMPLHSNPPEHELEYQNVCHGRDKPAWSI